MEGRNKVERKCNVTRMLTGLTALVMTKADNRTIEKEICKKARYIVREWGMEKKEEMTGRRRERSK